MHGNKMFRFSQEFLTWLNQKLLKFKKKKKTFIKVWSFDAAKRFKITKCPTSAAVL